MTKEIQLTQGKVALIDDEDYAEISKHKWGISHGYAHRAVSNSEYFSGKTHISMHVQIMKSDGDIVDHINGNRLDNRKCNLRLCTHRQNIINSKKRSNSASKYKGVNKHQKGWQVFIWNGVKNIHLGIFEKDNEVEAAKAYDKAAKEMHGKYAHLNFPE